MPSDLAYRDYHRRKCKPANLHVCVLLWQLAAVAAIVEHAYVLPGHTRWAPRQCTGPQSRLLQATYTHAFREMFVIILHSYERVDVCSRDIFDVLKRRYGHQTQSSTAVDSETVIMRAAQHALATGSLFASYLTNMPQLI